MLFKNHLIKKREKILIVSLIIGFETAFLLLIGRNCDSFTGIILPRLFSERKLFNALKLKDYQKNQRGSKLTEGFFFFFVCV